MFSRSCLVTLALLVGCNQEVADPDAPRDPTVPTEAAGPDEAPAELAPDPQADVLKSYPLVGALLIGSSAKSYDQATLDRLVEIDNAGKKDALAAALAFDEAAGFARGDLGTGSISPDHVEALVAADRALREVALKALVDGMKALPAAAAGPGATSQGEAPRAVSGTLGLLVSAEGRTVPEESGNDAYAKVLVDETARTAAWTKAFSMWMMTVSSRGSASSPEAFTAATRTLFDAGDASMRARLALAPRLLAATGNPGELLVSERFSAWLNLTWEGKPRAAGLPVPVVSNEGTPTTGSLPGPGGMGGPGMMPGMTMQPGAMQPGAMQPGAMQPGSMPPGSMQPGSMQPGSMQPGSMQPPPGSMQPGSMQPGSMQPGSMQPGSMQPPPGSMQPGSMQPGSMQPGSMQPGSMQPGSTQKPPAKSP